MSVDRLLKERERLERRLLLVTNAIVLLQELDGGSAAEPKVRQLPRTLEQKPKPKPVGMAGKKWSAEHRRKFMAYIQRRKAGKKALHRLNATAHPS